MEGLPRRGRWLRRAEPVRDEPVETREDPAPVQANGPTEVDEPVDLAAVHADDALIDAVNSGGGDPDLADDGPDAELRHLLAAWRQEIDSEPIGDLVDVDTAMRVIREAKTLRDRRGRRFVVPIASAAAAIALGMTGISAAAMNARPGDTLWPLATVLYSDHTRSIEAAASVRYELNSASSAMRAGRVGDARAALERASEKLGNVSTEDGLRELTTKHDSLRAQLETTPPVPTDETGSSEPITASRPSSPTASAPPSTRPETSKPSTTSPSTTIQPPTTTTTEVPTTPSGTSTVKPGDEAGPVTGRTGGDGPQPR